MKQKRNKNEIKKKQKVSLIKVPIMVVSICWLKVVYKYEKDEEIMKKTINLFKGVVLSLSLFAVLFFTAPVNAAGENNTDSNGNGSGQNTEGSSDVDNNSDKDSDNDSSKDSNNDSSKDSDQSNTANKSGRWMQSGARWWYLNPDGSYALGWKQIDGEWYYFDKDGYVATGWLNGGNCWYYLDDDGTITTGWVKDGNEWYLMDDDGKMVTGWYEKDGLWYYFDNFGVMLSGWQEIDGNWYYFLDEGYLHPSGWLNLGGTWYYLNDKQRMETGWLNIDGAWYLFKDNGPMYANGWKSVGGYWYYFESSGKMKTGKFTDVDGTSYDLGESGGIADPMAQKAQQYSSSTNYLILVNRSTHTVAIYSGKQGNWSTVKSFACTDGAATPTGQYTIGIHNYHFGEEKGYTCWYATQITGDILFHSVLYVPNSMTAIQDGRLGITASHGCIRLDISNAKYIYEKIPQGTKVVIY